mmetsp:Transcript_29125/g.44026  ORF Transcript_29125/g.44026 Transcript_29125/m.44026 type:complete len:316 (+) Transcript_29125:163-1110(+)
MDGRNETGTFESEKNIMAQFDVAECLVDFSRKTQQHGVAYVDNPEVISEELAAEVSMKAFVLKTFYAPPGAVLAKPSQGQVGFLRQERIPSDGRSQYAVTPVTAKHNLIRILETKTSRKVELNALEAGSYPPWDPQSKLYLVFTDLNWTPTDKNHFILRDKKLKHPLIWPFGIDISMGEKITSCTQGITSKDASFELAGKAYRFKAGQKIGIAVFSEHKPTNVTASYDPKHPSNFSVEQLKQAFGKPNQVNVYTGKIILAGDKHIEHDINSFTGCSGAVIFLLEGENKGKAVAIHAGSHPSMRTRNVGFKLVDVR